MRPTGPPPLLAAAARWGRHDRRPLRGGDRRATVRLRRGGCAVIATRGAALAALSMLEDADPLVHRLRLLLQRLGRRRVLLQQRRVLLRDLVHLLQRLVDLLDAGRLLVAGRGDLRHDLGHPLDRWPRSPSATCRHG